MLTITDYSNEFNYIREKTKDIVDCFYIGQSHNSVVSDNNLLHSWHVGIRHTNIVCYAVYKGINFKLAIKEEYAQFYSKKKSKTQVKNWTDNFIEIIKAIANCIDNFDFSVDFADCTFLEGIKKIRKSFLSSSPIPETQDPPKGYKSRGNFIILKDNGNNYQITFCEGDSSHPEFEENLYNKESYSFQDFANEQEYQTFKDFFDNQQKQFEDFLSSTVSKQKKLEWVPEEQRNQEKEERAIKKAEKQKEEKLRKQKEARQKWEQEKEEAQKQKLEEEKQKEAVRQELDKIESLIIEEGTEIILPNAYKNLPNLKEVIFPSSLKEIRTNAFLGCTGLTSITFPENLEKIDGGAFFGCTNLKHIEFGSLNISLGMNALGNVEQYDEQTKEKISNILNPSQKQKTDEPVISPSLVKAANDGNEWAIKSIIETYEKNGSKEIPPCLLEAAKNRKEWAIKLAAQKYEKKGDYKEAVKWYKKILRV